MSSFGRKQRLPERTAYPWLRYELSLSSVDSHPDFSREILHANGLIYFSHLQRVPVHRELWRFAVFLINPFPGNFKVCSSNLELVFPRVNLRDEWVTVIDGNFYPGAIRNFEFNLFPLSEGKPASLLITFSFRRPFPSAELSRVSRSDPKIAQWNLRRAWDMWPFPLPRTGITHRQTYIVTVINAERDGEAVGGGWGRRRPVTCGLGERYLRNDLKKNWKEPHFRIEVLCCVKIRAFRGSISKPETVVAVGFFRILLKFLNSEERHSNLNKILRISQVVFHLRESIMKTFGPFRVCGLESEGSFSGFEFMPGIYINYNVNQGNWCLSSCRGRTQRENLCGEAPAHLVKTILTAASFPGHNCASFGRSVLPRSPPGGPLPAGRGGSVPEKLNLHRGRGRPVTLTN